MCDCIVVIYICFTYIKTFYVSVWSETGHFWLHLFLLANLLFMLFYSQYVYTRCVCQRGWRLELYQNLIHMSIWKSSYMLSRFFFKSLAIIQRSNLVSVIHILIRLNHLSMVISCTIKGLGWRFPVIYIQAIILCEPLLHQYT